MRVLTATSETQGWRHNDFCWTVEGELVSFPVIECDCGGIDGECGCRRSVAGFVSHQATTTMKVVDRKGLEPNDFFSLLVETLIDQGYIGRELVTDREVKVWLHAVVSELTQLAESFPPGTVLERRGDVLWVRRYPERKVG